MYWITIVCIKFDYMLINDAYQLPPKASNLIIQVFYDLIAFFILYAPFVCYQSLFSIRLLM